MEHMYLTRGNKKYLIPGWRIRTFGIPAGRAANGKVTCPGAGLCRHGCYAKQGHYVCPNVKSKNEERFALTKRPEFVDVISEEIHKLKLDLVRIHDSGDFYSWDYLEDWFEICRRCAATKFLAYTKTVMMVRWHKRIKRQSLMVPPNLALVFSEGGRWDHLIDRSATSSPASSRAWRHSSGLDSPIATSPISRRSGRRSER